MKILLVPGTPEEFVPLAGVLRDRGHAIASAPPDEAEAALAREQPQLVLAAYGAAAAHEFALVRRARALPGGQYPYLAVVGDELTDAQLVAAYQAGIDADMRRPLGAGRLLAQLFAAERVGRVAPGPVPTATPAATAARPVVTAAAPPPVATPAAATPRAALPPLDLLCLTPAWQQARALLIDTASKFLTLPARVEDAVRPRTAAGIACEIVMSNVQQQLELRVALVCDQRDAQALAMHLFGEAGDDLAGDMLSELGNMFMGTLKTAFAEASFAFAAGIPAPIGPALAAQPDPPFQRQECFELVIADARVLVHLGVRGKGNSFVSPIALKEGAVVAKDIFNARGLLLVKGGTRLSTNMIEHIQSIVPAKQMVEVMAP